MRRDQGVTFIEASHFVATGRSNSENHATSAIVFLARRLVPSALTVFVHRRTLRWHAMRANGLHASRRCGICSHATRCVPHTRACRHRKPADGARLRANLYPRAHPRIFTGVIGQKTSAALAMCVDQRAAPCRGGATPSNVATTQHQHGIPRALVSSHSCYPDFSECKH